MLRHKLPSGDPKLMGKSQFGKLMGESKFGAKLVP